MGKVEHEIMERPKGDYNKKKNLLTKIYIAFNKNCDVNDGEFQCDDNAKLLENNYDLNMLYKKFIRNIKNLSNSRISYFNILDKEKNVDFLCIYLKHWIYNQLINANINKDYIPVFFSTWNSQKDRIFSGNNIPCQFYDLKVDEIKEIRKLYDYYMLYHTFEESKIINAKNYKNAYCFYLNVFKKIYNNNKTSCAQYVSENYCKEFEEYIKEKVNEDTLSSIDKYCEGEDVNKLINAQSVVPNQSDYCEASKKYGIFQVLDQYHDDEKKLIKAADDNNYKNICDIECDSEKCTNGVKAICEKFAQKFLGLSKPNSTKEIFHTDYAKILNYLFIQELRVTQPECNNKEYYEKIKEKCSSDIKLKQLENHISYMEDEEYNKLNILYELYDNLRKIDIQATESSRNQNSSSPEYDEKIVNIYQKGITLYEAIKEKDFYYALKEFSVLYKQYIYMDILSGNKKLKELPYFQAIENSKESDIQNEIPLIKSTISDIYNNFSKHTSDKTVCAKYCNEIIFLDKNNNEKIKAFCAKLATNLKQLDSINNVGNNHNDKCSNLKYWTYDQIFDIFRTENSYTNKSLIINKINQVIFRVNEELDLDKKCIFYVDTGYKDWVKERDLHFYFLNFDSLSDVEHVDDGNKMYCNYLNYIYNLHKENVKKCCARHIIPTEYMENKCQSYFNCDKKYYPIELMNIFKCENIDHKESVKDIFDSITVDLNVIRYSVFMNSFNQIINITNDPFYLFVLAVFGLLGFFFIFFIFYKFAPIGSSNRKRISRRNMDMRETSNYPRQESISYNKKSTNANPQRKRVQIAYQVT
ncbi:unnamed protein product [Plasmodium vivax]|uniref:(malaria parasite P. vivax) hypothetical protein n=1 Tax=Plasmodium vivax TaxID=5855 RepID=A0A8S4H8V0_PLAVI|nr:unnamed protein product [Plasmodium vivax]